MQLVLSDFSIFGFDNPLKALAAFDKKNEFDFIILDIMMPEMDGFQVLRKIREFSSIPIIMLTAKGDVSDKVVGLELGADDYLSKPFEPKELLARIQSILRRSQTPSAITSDIFSRRDSQLFFLATAIRLVTASGAVSPKASRITCVNSFAVPATKTTPPWAALNRRISGRSVATTGMPIARYSFRFVGYTLSV